MVELRKYEGRRGRKRRIGGKPTLIYRLCTWCPLVTAGLILLLRDTQRLRVGVETWRHRGVGGGWSHGEVQSFHHHEIRLPTTYKEGGGVNVARRLRFGILQTA